MTTTLILYSTLGCHLCEQALELVTPLLGGQYQIEEVDIADSEELMDRYGIRIPVIAIAADDTGAGAREIGWPFDADQFSAFLRTG